MPDLWMRRTASKDVRGTLWVRDRGGDKWVAGTRTVSKPTPAPTGSVVDRFLASKPFYVANRLGGTEYPEFTQKGLTESLKVGFKALELSVRRC